MYLLWRIELLIAMVQLYSENIYISKGLLGRVGDWELALPSLHPRFIMSCLSGRIFLVMSEQIQVAVHSWHYHFYVLASFSSLALVQIEAERWNQEDASPVSQCHVQVAMFPHGVQQIIHHQRVPTSSNSTSAKWMCFVVQLLIPLKPVTMFLN